MRHEPIAYTSPRGYKQADLFSVAIGSRSLGYSDRIPGHRPVIYALPRKRGESRADYMRRFFREVRGLGHVRLHLGRRIIGYRGW